MMSQFEQLPGKRQRHSHIFERAANNWYRDPPWCSAQLFKREPFSEPVWDGCCGGGSIPESAKAAGLPTFASDLIDRGYGIAPLDFLTEPAPIAPPFSVVTNPPHEKNSEQIFAQRAFELGAVKVVLLMQTTKLHAAWRWLTSLHLARVYLLTPRPSMPPGELLKTGMKPEGGRYDFSWAVFDPLHRGPPTLAWLKKRDESACGGGEPIWKD
jgi:hypothetical protein